MSRPRDGSERASPQHDSDPDADVEGHPRDTGESSARTATEESGVVARGVSVSLGGQRVLSEASIAVDRGELVGLVGPNGAGKTTLLRTLNGTLAPDAGTVRVDGEDVHALSARARSRRVATVPQDTSVGFAFDVRTIVEMGRHPHRSRFGGDPDPGAVDRALERAGVDHLADRSVDAVSGGERSRVLLARALAQDADALVLDEPTASLDIGNQVDTLELVTDLVDEGRAAVAAIHDLNLAARFCDRIVVLVDGQVQARGPPETTLERETLRAAFGVTAAVDDHPATQAPLVTALTESDRGE